MAADIDMTWNLESLPIQWRMSRQGRLGSTCLTSNRKVLGQRLPSIAIAPHTTITSGWGFEVEKQGFLEACQKISSNRPNMIVCSLRKSNAQRSRSVILSTESGGSRV